MRADTAAGLMLDDDSYNYTSVVSDARADHSPAWAWEREQPHCCCFLQNNDVDNDVMMQYPDIYLARKPLAVRR